MIRKIFRHVFRFAIYSWDLEFAVTFKKNRFRKYAVRTTLVVIPLALVFYTVSGNLEPPHQFSQSECFNCHFTVPYEDEPRPYRFVEPVTALCTGCHDSMDRVSHYVNDLADETYDVSMPVIEPGKITCATCHDPHMPAVDPVSGEKTYFLRGGVRGKDQCAQCHNESMPSYFIFTLLPVMDKAHGVADITVLDRLELDYSGRRLPGVFDVLVTLDDLSIYCLNCHDDPGIPEMTQPGSEIYMAGEDNGLSHPVGIDYEDAARNNPELKLWDRDPNILLFDGKIGCCSCHDPYAPGVSMGLRAGNDLDYSDLCMGCHVR